MSFKLPDSVYNVLKWVGLIVLPALATFYGLIAPYWNLPYPDAIVVTINGLGVFIGTLIGVSSKTISNESEG